jgi:hypothetical protein
MGLWFLPVEDKEDEKMCESITRMVKYMEAGKTKDEKSLLNKCCVPGDYWKAPA